MRGSSLAFTVLVAAAFPLVGCGQPASPVSPTSAQSGSASAPSSPPASAASLPGVPFTGTMQGTDVDSDRTATSIVVTTDGGGNATHLGRFTFTQRVTVSFTTSTSAGTAHWVAANGDTLDTTIAGSGHPTGTPGELRIVDVHTISGGTGRFNGVHGSFTVDRLASGITFTTSGAIDGTIALQGGAS